MKAVFPGKPQAKLHALCTALWEGQRLVVYISNNTLIILNGPNHLLQTISHAESDFLEAVAISDASGKIATCTATTVFVYRPVGHDVGDLRWALQHTLTPSCADSSLTCLSWGLPDEVLASGSHATLFHTNATAHETWSRELANPAKSALFTPDASFIASTGWHDRLVKIWERVFLSDEQERVDVSYLSHPATVTGLRWHRRPDQEHHPDTVLYTICADSKLRIWAATDHHALQPLQLWTELDLAECILPRTPRSPGADPPKRYVFVVDGWEFEAMIEQAIHRQHGGERQRHTREHLLDVAYRNPDICVIMDDSGNMSAWGLERVGCKARQPNDIFNILLVEHVDLPLPKPITPSEDYLCLCSFAGLNDGTLNVITNLFDGAVHWLSSPVDQFFDTGVSSKRFDVDAIWTGLAEPIQSLVSSPAHKALLSVGSHQESMLWLQDTENAKAALVRQGTCQTSNPISLACLISNDRYAVILQGHLVSLWTIQDYPPSEIATCDTQLSSSVSCLVALSDSSQGSGEYIALVTDTMEGVILRVMQDVTSASVRIETFASLQFDNSDKSTAQKFMAVKQYRQNNSRDPAVYSLTASGVLHLWCFDINPSNNTCTLKPVTSVRLEMKDPFDSRVGSNGKAAIVSKSRNCLAIWDTNLKHLEYMETFKTYETIDSLDMTCTEDDKTLLAVSFSHKALIYAQNRYSFAHEDPPWILLKTVEIGQQTSIPISDCLWLSTHDLLLAAGNQMFLFEGAADLPDCIISSIELPTQVAPVQELASIVDALNAVPAVFTPEVNTQVLASGNLDLVDLVFNKLRTTLKFWSPGDALESNLGLGVIDCLKLDEVSVKRSVDSSTDLIISEATGVFAEDSAAALNDILGTVDLPFVSTVQQSQLASMGESLAFFEKHRDSVDNFAVRYLVSLYRHVNKQPSGRPQLGFREISWAFHSNSQDILIDLTSRIYGGRMIWRDARECGMFLWINDIETVRAQFEVIARNEYTKTDERNPLDCSLYYLALKKKQVLEGLWRLASWHRERNATMRLLKNNFNDARWKTAAMKNAYALLSFRRFEYAAAFFLLADHPKDAVTVIANQQDDIQLAIAVARVYEGDGGPVLRELLQETVLPKAANDGDKWLATWAYWMLHEKDKALKALTEPLENLITLSEPPPLESKHYRKNEPALAHHYALLRDRCQQPPRQAISVHPRAEWDLVMRSAISYVRAGCHFLALDLVRNWKFTDRTMPLTRMNGLRVTANTGATAFDARNEAQAVDNLWAMSSEREGKSIEDGIAENKPNGTAFPERKKVVEEPSTASILDNFNF